MAARISGVFITVVRVEAEPEPEAAEPSPPAAGLSDPQATRLRDMTKASINAKNFFMITIFFP